MESLNRYEYIEMKKKLLETFRLVTRQIHSLEIRYKLCIPQKYLIEFL